MNVRSVVTLAIGLVVAACDRADRAATKPPAEPTEPTAKVPPQPPRDAPALTGCAALTRADCLTSMDCTLRLIAPDHYECRAASGPCETGILQEDKKACEARTACRFVPGNCYCECPGPGVTMRVPDVVADGFNCGCACGGGPPSRCIERTATK